MREEGRKGTCSEPLEAESTAGSWRTLAVVSTDRSFAFARESFFRVFPAKRLYWLYSDIRERRDHPSSGGCEASHYYW